MNLMKLFNFNYLKENFKKSKVILSIFTGLIPILNTIILLMIISNDREIVLSFNELSIVNFMGIYILPIIISICLFNYIYKKNSVDFVNSMPISRKSIFFTNLLGGIILFLSMLIVNVILILIVSQIFNLQIPFMMIFDYLWYWFIVYLFAFCASNLAMSVSGNAITEIVVTLLLFFLVPFLCTYTKELNNNNYKYYYDALLSCNNKECLPEKYYCYNDTECNINKNANLYNIDAREIKDVYKYNSLFGIPYIALGNPGDGIINQSNILSMVTLSIVYTVLGYILFIKRKMEVSETTFKNKHIHNIVKSLTLVPFIALFYSLCQESDNITIIFVVVLMLIYYFVYDLITKKSIHNIKLSLVYFVSTLCIFTVIFSLIQINSDDKNIIDYENIKEISIPLSIYEDNTDKYIFIDNKELISIIIKNSVSSEEKNRNYYENAYIKLESGDIYSVSTYLNKGDYDRVIDIISSNEKYIKEYKNLDLNNIYAVKLGNKVYNKKDSQSIINLLNENINKLSLKEFMELQNKNKYINNNSKITLYSYKKHELNTYEISGYINYDILNSIIESNNSYLSDNITNIIPEDYEVYAEDFFIEDYEVDYFLLKSSKNDIYNFILKEINNKVDIHNEYITLELYIDGNNYYFTTNNVTEFKNILNKKYEEVKDTNEYKEYYYHNDIEEVYIDEYKY